MFLLQGNKILKICYHLLAKGIQNSIMSLSYVIEWANTIQMKGVACFAINVLSIFFVT